MASFSSSSSFSAFLTTSQQAEPTASSLFQEFVAERSPSGRPRAHRYSSERGIVVTDRSASVMTGADRAVAMGGKVRGRRINIGTVDPTRVGLAVVANLIGMTIGAVISIQQRMPYEFGGHGDPSRVASDFIGGGGTAVAPPLSIMVILAVLGAFAALRGKWATIPLALICVLAIIGGIGFLGEPHTWRVVRPSSFDGPWAVYDLITVVLIASLPGTAGFELIARFRNGGRRPPYI
jgi:hypothetical protein